MDQQYHCDETAAVFSYTNILSAKTAVSGRMRRSIGYRGVRVSLGRRSEFTKAAQRYLHELDAQLLTGQIDRPVEHPVDEKREARRGQQHTALETRR